jgi:tetratricopeptide (TPR) repeat protein
MKNQIIILAFTFIVSSLIAQQKGINQLPTANRQLPTSTYAVVVGISDYQDPAIPDLRYADKDARAFADFLRSSAGGNLDNDHLKVLINEKATVAQFAIQLDWLLENAKENDKVIIYFSGHGDVEKKTVSQPGYLLCWDAPARVYLAGGALALPMFQDIITTLSTQNKSKVIVITDACRSGKLAGSSIGGSQITGANLAKQYSNEIKILSCQPNEYSIEGEQWGGGRGVFSYHLIDALYGLADKNNDLWVTLQEVGRYLEDHVSNEVAPVNQLPMMLGNGNERLTSVDEKLLASIKSGKLNQTAVLTSIESRGMEDEVLSQLDTSTKKVYALFKKALKEKVFLEPVDACAESYYQQLIAEPKMQRLRSTIKRNYAAALQDDAQQVINNWLKSDPKEINLSPIAAYNKYHSYPKQLDIAAKLLGESHYMYSILKARKYFFDGEIIRLTNSSHPTLENAKIAMINYQEALRWQDNMPNALVGIAWLYGISLLNPDSLEYYTLKATELVPGWILPYCNLIYLFSSEQLKQFERAKNYLKLAEDLDSNSSALWNAEGNFYLNQSQFNNAETAYKKAIKLDSSNKLINHNLALVNWNIQKYSEAEELFLRTISLDSTYIDSYVGLGLVYISTKQFEKAEKLFFKVIQLDSNHSLAHYNLACIYSLNLKIEDAFKYLELALKRGLNWFDFIQQDEDLTELRKYKERWDLLMKKYFSEKIKN